MRNGAKTLTLRLPPELHDALKVSRDEMQLSLNAEICRLLKQGLERHELEGMLRRVIREETQNAQR